jgi:hypothetical protein
MADPDDTGDVEIVATSRKDADELVRFAQLDQAIPKHHNGFS